LLLEWAAVQDVLGVGKALDERGSQEWKIDFDFDSDFDPDESNTMAGV